MKATELRIGNLARSGQIVEVEAWMLLPESKIVFEGIDLTEEWLLKFGFEKRYEGFYLLRFLIEAGISQLFDNGFSFRITTSNSESTHAASIKYVHQLQNLYFALTGEELELKK